MATGLVLGAVVGMFGVFMVGLGYAQWVTRGIEVYRAEKL
ncbi:MAG: hypothetical protein JWQ22_1296 [Devosia sp.]|nr:hypothetical protein [Devosia sp.]